MREKRTEWTSEGELPVEIPLPDSFHFHSIFTCPVSKEQSTEDNPPMLLTCGHCLCKNSLLRLAKADGQKIKCPYDPFIRGGWLIVGIVLLRFMQRMLCRLFFKMALGDWHSSLYWWDRLYWIYSLRWRLSQWLWRRRDVDTVRHGWEKEEWAMKIMFATMVSLASSNKFRY